MAGRQRGETGVPRLPVASAGYRAGCSPRSHGWSSAVRSDRDVPTGSLVAAAEARAQERHERRRSWLRPLGWVVIVMVAVPGIEGLPSPGIHGAGPGVTL